MKKSDVFVLAMALWFGGCAIDRAPIGHSETQESQPRPDRDDAPISPPENPTTQDSFHENAQVPEGPDRVDIDTQGDTEQVCHDFDGDGAPEGIHCQHPALDCNDMDDTIHPGAQERCDGVDNDCNGVVDEGVRNACGGCNPLHSEPGTSCGHCGVYQCAGAEEVRCVGGEAHYFYADADGDGYGAGAPVPLCAPAAPYTSLMGHDCNDHDPAVSPSAHEVCDGGLDNDCDPSSTELDVCPLLRFDPPTARWTVPRLNFSHALAPKLDVVAAFDSEQGDTAWLLTHRTWHRFSVSRNVWIDSGLLQDDFPELDQVEIRWAYAVPANHHHTGLRLRVGTDTSAYLYVSDPSFESFQLEDVVRINDWTGPFAPELTEAEAVWLDVDYREPWFTAEPGDFCHMGQGHPLNTVSVVMTAHAQHVQESGYCFRFVERVENDAFFPFTRQGAPVPDTVTAAFWLDGLYTLRQ